MRQNVSRQLCTKYIDFIQKLNLVDLQTQGIQSLQKGLRRALSPLVPLAVFVAGAVPRASRRGCGARCRRWCRWPSSWQAQYPEPPEGAAARVVAAGAACCLRQAQYPEPPEGAAARVVAAGCLPRGRRSTQTVEKGLRRALSPLVPLAAFGRRSTQSPQKGLRRALSPLVPLAVLVAGAVPRASRRGCGARCRRWCRWLSSWQAQYPEPPSKRGCGARCRRWCRWLSSWQAQYPEPHRRGCGARCRRWCRWPSSLWQAQYPEPPEGAAARVVAAGAAGCPRGRRSTQSLQKGLRRALSPLVPLAVFLVAGAVPRASRRGCGARCRRWCRWLSSWQAQYQSLQKGLRRTLSPLVPLAVFGRRSTQSLQKGLRRALSPLVPLAVLVAGAVSRVS